MVDSVDDLVVLMMGGRGRDQDSVGCGAPTLTDWNVSKEGRELSACKLTTVVAGRQMLVEMGRSLVASRLQRRAKDVEWQGC